MDPAGLEQADGGPQARPALAGSVKKGCRPTRRQEEKGWRMQCDASRMGVEITSDPIARGGQRELKKRHHDGSASSSTQRERKEQKWS
jgi:hypothetical protein